MSKRPTIDLAALTSEAAAPMAEATQRAPRSAATPAPVPAPPTHAEAARQTTRTANLQGLAFKVPPAFRKRFRQRAADADLKLNELLFAALEAWEEKQGLKR
jgi:hypothetical protein